MRRTLAALLVAALITAPAAVASLHVHAYEDHDHPEHHHGPAAHGHENHDRALRAGSSHHGVANIPEGPGARVESCEPGAHVLAVRMIGAPGPQFHVGFAEAPAPSVRASTLPVRVVLNVTDIRVHGPPFDIRIPSRAPPPTPLA